MPVGSGTCFTGEHITAHALNASPQLAEQAIHCLELVAQLVRSGLRFQFKGGNSLLLILDEPRRFSIDVDIATDETRERIDACVEECVRRFGVFTRIEKRPHKTKPWIPLTSYNLYYRSLFPAQSPPCVMLDAQLRRSPYATGPRAVACGGLYRSGERAEVPFPSSIIGDKLLTLGPSTLGIPVGKGKQAQRLKHVFDLSTLLALGPDLGEIRASFSACLAQENELQGRALSGAEIVEDTVAYCATVMPFAASPPCEGEMAAALRENIVGLQPFAAHLFAAGYGWRHLQTDLARVALCITAVGRPEIDNDQFQEALGRTAVPGTRGTTGASMVPENPEAGRCWEILCRWLGRNPAGA